MTPAPMAFPNTTLRHFSADAQSETCLPNKSGPAGIDTGARCSAIDHGHSGMVRRTRPGISRFRIRFAPRNDGVYSGMTVSVSVLRNRAIGRVENGLGERKFQHDLALIVGHLDGRVQ